MTESNISLEAIASRDRVRHLLHEGVRWRVYESRLGQYDRRSRPHLFFESTMAIRRVRDFPPNWYGLPDEALMAVAGGR